MQKGAAAPQTAWHTSHQGPVSAQRFLPKRIAETGSKMPYLTLLSHKNLKREKLVVATKVLQINYIHLKYPKREVCSLCCALFWFMRHAICELAWFRAVRWLQIQYKCAGYARQHSEPTFSIFLCLNQTHTFFLIPVSTSLYAHTSYFFP